MDWPENLTTFHGGRIGKSTLRGMEMEAGGMMGIRRVERRDPDGTVHILKTRNGFPEVTTIRPTYKALVEAIRGFAAHVPSAPRATVFSPYTLAIWSPAGPVFDHKYTVLPFASAFNVPEEDTTLWNDTLSFHGTKVLVNGKEMAALGVTAPPAGALPWLLPHSGTGIEKYGDAAVNTTEKRIFAVSPAFVHSWMPGAADAALSGEAYRPGKAQVLGPRINASANEAWMSQFVFTGPTWDDLTGGWGFMSTLVAMTLTPPYLTRTLGTAAVDQPSCVPQIRPTVESDDYIETAFPPTDLCLKGTGVYGTATTGNLNYGMEQRINFPLTETVTHAVTGKHRVYTLQSVWDNTYSLTQEVAGRSLSVSASNSYRRGSSFESYTHDAFTKALFASTGNGTARIDNGLYNIQAATFVQWSLDALSPPPNVVPRSRTGSGDYVHQASSIPGLANFTTLDCAGDFTVALGPTKLIDVHFSRHEETGDKLTLEAIAGRYAVPLSNPWAYVGQAYGIGSLGVLTVLLEATNFDAAVWQLNATADARRSILAARASQRVGGMYYDWNDGDETAMLYETHSSARPSGANTTLTWTTKDFILYDEPNQVFVSVEGSFVGSQTYGSNGAATLTVLLKIDTPLGVATQPLLTYGPIVYGDLLEKQELQPAVYYVPSPKLRAIFTPMHQEQGDFNGAAYTTAAEVNAGAIPAYLMNFVLKLDTYAAIGADDSAASIANFIPANLIEMLYCYVYSQKYGNDLAARYPVDYPLRFSELNASLFSNQWRVNYRDGAMIDWLDTLGTDYVTPTTTELYRI